MLGEFMMILTNITKMVIKTRKRKILMNIMYHLLESMDEAAVARDLDRTNTLNRLFSINLNETCGNGMNQNPLYQEGGLAFNFDRARNNYLLVYQGVMGGHDFFKEGLSTAREYLSKIEEQLLAEGIKVIKTLKSPVDKTE